MSIIVGLLVGHWITQSKSSGPQVLRVEGLSAGTGASAARTGTTAASTTAATTPKPAETSTTSAKVEAKEVKEAKAIEKAPLPKPVKSAAKLQKIGGTTGKKHVEEVNKLGDQPIETE